MKILHVAGARPNFMKIAPIIREMKKYPEYFDQILVHTGQHYDRTMSDIFFEELGIPMPNIHLGVGSGSHAEQTGKIMIAFEKVVKTVSPDAILVVGDVNSTIACSLVAVKMGIRVIHVEAGLRSFDRSMPEEINRILTDRISDILFITEKSANTNLLNEGVDPDRIHFVGNVMIDTLLRFRNKAEESSILNQLDISDKPYALLTLHRPSNVDIPEKLSEIIDALIEIQKQITIIFPAHPRTMKRMEEFGLTEKVNEAPMLRLQQPVGYLDFINLEANSVFVMTDSGGIQEETTILGVPCLTLRENTERPSTIEMGTNRLVGTEKENIINAARSVLESEWQRKSIPPKWDGKAAERIAAVLMGRNSEGDILSTNNP